MKAWGIVRLIRSAAAISLVVCVRSVCAGGERELVESARLTRSESSPNAGFGRCVAIAGDTAIVGAVRGRFTREMRQCAAEIFVRNGSEWARQAKLTAPDASAFAESVAISGNTVIVGAWYDRTQDVSSAGSVFVFVRTGDTWTRQAKLTAPDLGFDGVFAWRIAIDGDTVIVTAGTVTARGVFGSAYVFVRRGDTWTVQAKLTGSDATTCDWFGRSVAIAGDTAILGAWDGPRGPTQGSAYVFVRTGNTWTQQAKLITSDADAFDSFGQSVGISGDTAIVGAEAYGGSGRNSQGSVYVFIRTGSAWTQQCRLTASDATGGNRFGESVAIAGDKVIVGADLDDGPAGDNQGAAYVFVRTGRTWTQEAKLTASNAGADHFFGQSVAIAGETAIVGAWRDDGPEWSAQGSAYIFGSSGESVKAKWRSRGERRGGQD